MQKMFRFFSFEIDLVPVLLFVLSAILWRTPYARYGLYLVIPLTIFFSYFKYYKNIVISKYFIPYLLLLLLMFFSSYINENNEESMKEMLSVTATFLLSFSVLSLSEKGDNSKIIAIGFICLFATIFYMTITSGNFNASFDYANEKERRGNTEMNANQYAYFSLYAIMAFRLLLGNKPVKSAIIRMALYLGLGFLAFYVALLTASRQVLLLEIPVLLYCMYYDFFKNGTPIQKIVITFSGIFVIVFLLPIALESYSNSYLYVRSAESLQEDSRIGLLLTGFFQGLENPLLGIGLGAETSYSHCTYTHLMSRCGIPTALLYIYMVCIAIKDQIVRYRITKDPYFRMYLFLLLIFAAANFFYSYHNQPYMLPVLFLIVGDSNRNFAEYCIIESEE